VWGNCEKLCSHTFSIKFGSGRRFSEWICGRLCWPSFTVFLTAAGSRSDSRHGKLHVTTALSSASHWGREPDSQLTRERERERETERIWQRVVNGPIGKERVNERLCKDVLRSLGPKSRNGLELKERNWEGDFERVCKKSKSKFIQCT